MNTLRKIREDYELLLRSVPAMVTTTFILSVIFMNIFASKEILRTEYFCFNGGLLLSWISFLCMDCICKRFGPKAATKLSVLAMAVNVLCSIVFWLMSIIPGTWAASYASPDSMSAVNAGLNSTFAGAWYVVLGSCTAMFLSTLVNATLNSSIGKKADNGKFLGFAVRSLPSTCIAQFVDNLVFSTMVSHVFFGWNWKQVLICSFTAMVFELGLEAVFSPFGYKVSKNWEKRGVGRQYIEMLAKA